MSDLRAAAERLLDKGMGAIDRPPWVAKAAMDLARAYLAEHPPDDDEPITEAWLREMGFDSDDTGNFQLTDRSEPIVLEIEGDVLWMVSPETIPVRLKEKLTRGDLRRLLAALGIPLPEKT